jgi:hypothetical protein
VTPHQVYDQRDAKDASTRLLNDLIAFLDDDPALTNQPCPLSPGEKFTMWFWKSLGLQLSATASGASPSTARRVETQSPLVGAQVQLTPVGVPINPLDFYTTDEAGGIHATLLPGRYLLSVSASGYATRQDTLIVSGEGDERVLRMNVQQDLGYAGPTEPRLTIAGGAASVSDTLVTLGMSCTGATEMKVEESADLSDVPWLPMTASRQDTLRGGGGLHLRYARFRDGLGRESNTVVAAVRLNTAQGTGVSVSATPTEGTATVDGMPDAASTPAVFDRLEPGFHYVSVRRPGWISSPGVQVAEVDSGAIVPVAFQLTPAQPPSAGSWVKPLPDQYLGPLAQLEWTSGTDPDVGDVVMHNLEFGQDAAIAALVFTLTGATGTHVPLPAVLADSSEYFARITAVDGHETPQATPAEVVRFRVDRTAPTGHVTFPEKGAVVLGASPPALRFEVSDWSGVASALVTLSTDGGTTYPDTLYAGAYADGLPWIAPAIQSEQCRVRLVVGDRAGNVATMESDSLFTLHGISTDVGGVAPPTSFSLQVRPQPARTGATIGFDLPIQTAVRLEVFDVAGRSVRMLAAGQYAPGSYSLPWDLRGGDGARLSAGVFFLRLQASGQSRLSRVVIVQ